MDEDTRKILEAGCQAPSGSNSQPWKFRVKGNEADILAFPEKDHPILNYRNRGTWIAHGALLENIAIAAPVFGYRANIKMISYDANSRIIARVSFEKSEKITDPLYPAIFSRATNRKPYANKPLTEEQKRILSEAAKNIPAGEVKLVSDPEKLKLLGEAVAVNEIVMFENPVLRKLMFQEIVWTEEEEKRKGGGLFVETMELKPPQEFALKIFKSRFMANLFNKMGAAKFIAKENAKNYASAALMGIVVVEDKDEKFFDAGRIIERLWLRAAASGLNFHLITGVMFLNMRFAAGQTGEFSLEHVRLVKSAYKTIADIFGVNSGVIAGLFRAGYGEPPSARSIRLKPDIIIN